MSLNIHGVGFSPKYLALKRWFEVSLSNAILLQEMVVLGYKATKVLLKLLFEWECRNVDAIGLNIG